MEIQRAVYTLQHLIDCCFYPPFDERNEAIRLGMEALDRVRASRTWERPDPLKPLPSEAGYHYTKKP